FCSVRVQSDKPISAMLDNGVAVELVQQLDKSCKEEVLFRNFVRRVRAQWYALLSNFLSVHITDEGVCAFTHIEQPVPPLVLKDMGNILYAAQKVLPFINPKDIKRIPPVKFIMMNGMNKSARWGVFDTF